MTVKLGPTGVYPPIPTPFDERGDLLLPQLATNLARWDRWPLGGYVVGGSNGEFTLLTDEERVEVVRAARESIPAGKLLIAGSGAQSTRRVVELTGAMAEVGADAALVVTPAYYRRQMNAAALVSHYSLIASEAAIPILLYNVPANTGIDLPVEAVTELAEHPNVIGMKDSGGDIVRLGSIIEATTDEFQLLAGGASFYLAALALGAVGVVPALGNLAGDKLVEIGAAFRSGEIDRAADIQRSLLAANHAVTAGYGVPGLKAGLDMLGFYGGPVRPPLQPLADRDRKALRQILQEAGILQ